MWQVHNTYSMQYALHYICSVVPRMRRKEDVCVTICGYGK